jgi:hypothetical protein
VATTPPVVPQDIETQYVGLLANIQVLQGELSALKTTIDFDGNNGTGILFQAVATLEAVVTSMSRAKTAMETQYPGLLDAVTGPSA